MSDCFHIDHQYLTLQQVENIFYSNQTIALSEQAKIAVQTCRAYLDKEAEKEGNLHYGINTGFGSLCNVAISPSELAALQLNLIRSHACGVGDLVPKEVIKMMLFLKVQGLALGHSGVQQDTLELLCSFYNRTILPQLFELGSLGASGDLAPLAHLSLPLVGEGKVYYNNELTESHQALQAEQLSPIQLKSKEGLALLNGTQFSLAYSVILAMEGQRLLTIANRIAALSCDVFACNHSPFDALIHQVRPHKGQVLVAKNILNYLSDSQLSGKPTYSVQDPYCFRCIPQVHGASYDAIQHFSSIVETEINSVTDNPLIFPDEGKILSGGNFHAQPLALVLDYVAIALAELGNISERRLYQLIGGQRDLPVFLTKNAGLHSGLMIAQYTAASIVSQNKQWCTPASVDSIVSCNGQEDHVSMAANAATKGYKVLQNAKRLLAIELMTACQAADFRGIKSLSTSSQLLVNAFRQSVESLGEDRIISYDIAKAVDFINNRANFNDIDSQN